MIMRAEYCHSGCLWTSAYPCLTCVSTARLCVCLCVSLSQQRSLTPSVKSACLLTFWHWERNKDTYQTSSDWGDCWGKCALTCCHLQFTSNSSMPLQLSACLLVCNLFICLFCYCSRIITLPVDNGRCMSATKHNKKIFVWFFVTFGIYIIIHTLLSKVQSCWINYVRLICWFTAKCQFMTHRLFECKII